MDRVYERNYPTQAKAAWVGHPQDARLGHPPTLRCIWANVNRPAGPTNALLVARGSKMETVRIPPATRRPINGDPDLRRWLAKENNDDDKW